VNEIASRLGLGLNAAAEGIMAVATNNMINATQEILVGQGFDPRDFTLISFGGGGGIFAGNIARGMSISRLIVPFNPGVFSAQGILTMNLVHTYSRAFSRELESVDMAELDSLYREIESTARKTLYDEGMNDKTIEFLRSMDICYEGQRYYIDTPVRNGVLKETSAIKADIADVYRRLYRSRYGHLIEAPLKTINIRLKAIGRIQEIPTREIKPGQQIPQNANKKPRRIYIEGKFTEVPVFEREGLEAGNSIRGPAIIEEPYHVTLLTPGQHLLVDKYGNLVIQAGGA
jgi:N-methylhydantoinase A